MNKAVYRDIVHGYSSMPKLKSYIKGIGSLRARYYSALPGKEDLMRMVLQAEVPEQVYNSNAIENSTLTLEETERILLDIDLDRFISQRELFEAKNLARVVEYIETKAKESELTLDVILLLHKMLLSNIRDEVAGRYRGDGEYVRVGAHVAPGPKEVIPRLEKMLQTYLSAPDDHIVRRVAAQHLEFEHTHPFVDGNGRMGRVLINYLLVREGYVPVTLQYSKRDAYYSALRAYDLKKDSTSMEYLIGQAIMNSYHKRLAYLEGKKIITLKEFTTVSGQSHSNLLNKAERQTIEAFIERGVWKIGIA